MSRHQTFTRPSRFPSPRRQRHVVPEELFSDILARERKRADRLQQTFGLVLVGVRNPSHGSPSASTWRAAVRSLDAVAERAGVLGWMTTGRVLAAIVPDRSGHVDARVRQRLEKHLDANGVHRFAVQSIVYSPRSAHGDGWWIPDPLTSGTAAADRSATAGYTIKRALDIAGSLALLVLLAPVLLTIVVVISLTSPGPFLFRQRRLGQMATSFTMLKFRTMSAAADQKVHREFVTKFIKSSSQQRSGASMPAFNLVDDPRVLPVGRFLRKTGLDELPQLWNVLRGEMSLVGPRPPLPYEVDQYQPWHLRRVLEAKPGLTGLWQVTGRRRTTFDEMVRLDLRYVKTCSLWTDIKILLATPVAVMSGGGAG